LDEIFIRLVYTWDNYDCSLLSVQSCFTVKLFWYVCLGCLALQQTQI